MILDNKDYDVQGTIKCKCGYEFNIKDMEELEDLHIPGFYGNTVKYFSYAHCPKCNKETILLLQQVGQTYKVIDIATPKENDIIIKTVTNLDDSIDTTIKKEERINVSEESICPVCGKACKSQLGLNAHLRTHNN